MRLAKDLLADGESAFVEILRFSVLALCQADHGQIWGAANTCKALEEEQARKRVEMEGIEPWKERAVSGWCSPRYRLRMSRLRL